jgi:hypothetical protein
MLCTGDGFVGWRFEQSRMLIEQPDTGVSEGTLSQHICMEHRDKDSLGTHTMPSQVVWKPMAPCAESSRAYRTRYCLGRSGLVQIRMF